MCNKTLSINLGKIKFHSPKAIEIRFCRKRFDEVCLHGDIKKLLCHINQQIKSKESESNICRQAKFS